MNRERVRCKKCGKYLVKAETSMGPLDEEGLVMTFKLMSKYGGVGSVMVCDGCGGHSFELVAVPDAPR